MVLLFCISRIAVAIPKSTHSTHAQDIKLTTCEKVKSPTPSPTIASSACQRPGRGPVPNQSIGISLDTVYRTLRDYNLCIH